MSITIRDDRHFRSLTGVTQKQFDILPEAFTSIFETLRQRVYQDGGKGAPPSMRDRLLFVLYYLMLRSRNAKSADSTLSLSRNSLIFYWRA